MSLDNVLARPSAPTWETPPAVVEDIPGPGRPVLRLVDDLEPDDESDDGVVA